MNLWCNPIFELNSENQASQLLRGTESPLKVLYILTS